MSWRGNEESPADFDNILYYKEELESDVEDSDIEDEYDRAASPTPSSYSPLTSLSRDRSRSPIKREQLLESVPVEVVLRIFDENEVHKGDFDFVDPDSHALFKPPEGSMDVDSGGRVSERELRGRRGGGRGMRGIRGRGGRGRSRQVHKPAQCAIGHPLTEIWLTDDDIPPELVWLVTDVVRSRVRKLQSERNESERRNLTETDDIEDFFDANDDLTGDFKWYPMASFQGKEEEFTQERTGSVHFHNSPYDAFRSFWDDGILNLIVAETNQYASKITANHFRVEWIPTNADEILCLFAFWMMLGIIKMPTYTSCFSLDPLLKTEIFRRIFTKKRYVHLSRALNFIDPNSNPVNHDSIPSTSESARCSDRLHSLRPILNHLNVKFKSEYILDKEICIDESLTLWKGLLDFRQYIKTKASKFGIKTFELCESATGYLWSFLVYSGKHAADLETAPDTLKSASIVKNIINPLLNKGHKLFMNNWYNSPLLARFLKANGTDCVGTLDPSRRDVPALIRKVSLKRGEIIARHSGDVTLLAWQDMKRVTMISTCHGSATALPRVPSRNSVRPVPFKPQVVLDYNKFMGGVDLKDQMLEPYLLERKRCNKWYMKLFKRLLNVSILNSRILLQSCTGEKYDHLAFRLQLVDTILEKHLNRCPLSRRNAAANRKSAHELPVPAGPHWPALHESTSNQPTGGINRRKRCVVCLRAGKSNSKTTYCCEVCKVPLCIPQCFKSYHEVIK